jgi:hypothetical protein
VGSPEQRRLMEAAREMLRDELRATLKDIDLGLGRVETLRTAIEEGLAAVQETAEGATRGQEERLRAFEARLGDLGDLPAALVALRASLAGLEARIEAHDALDVRVRKLEQRPAAAAAPATDPAAGGRPRSAEPAAPTLPEPERKDPELVRAEVAKARADLLSDELPVLFAAIDKVREHRVMDVSPRLIEVLLGHKEELARTAAAAALGELRIADAVPALADALVDSSEIVAQQANMSIRLITTFDTELSATAGMRRRRSARGRVKEWWRTHEGEVREGLGQAPPAGSGPDEG